ncbi:hypothetical protein FRC06_005912 [Ceratobasidium sp. 370]|nr:hypothetical protein FRC06_005912 [Ceratobasidium sp. 370]
MDEDEHWWFAEVYQAALEHDHPADFLTLMHMGNEDEHRLSPSDSDRFLALHRLSCMRRDNLITLEVYRANHDRMIRAVVKDVTRQGLSNLMCSEELADAIAGALQHPYLCLSFNASTWGKKLVKGRFYKLAACLVDEMVEQCRLLLDKHVDISEKPFMIPAQSCTWSQLEAGVKKKDHPWRELPGGAVAALSRVRHRNPEFSTFLNPSGTDGWTLPQVALLPAVLTSDHVFSCLKDMYHLAQHLTHITAGPDYLAKYTSNSPHSGDDDHPVGIIAMVLKDKLAGKPSNFPHKIIHTLWNTRELLLAGLSSAGISTASETSRQAYKKLIQESQPWWELLRMYKMSTLPGLGLLVPKVFAQATKEKQADLLQAIRHKQQAELASQDPGTHSIVQQQVNSAPSASPVTYGPRVRSPSLVVEPPSAPAASMLSTSNSPTGNSGNVSWPAISQGGTVTEAEAT